MSLFPLETSIEVDLDIKWMARQLGIDTTDITLMTTAILNKALNLCKFIVNERKNGARVFIENSKWRYYRNEIKKI